MAGPRRLEEQLDMQNRMPILQHNIPLHSSLFGWNHVSYEVTQVMHAQRTIGQSEIDHPNVIKHWGSTSYLHNEQGHVYDKVELSLYQLNNIIPLVNQRNNQSTERLIDLIRQLLNGLGGLKEDLDQPHGNLTAHNVGIQLFPSTPLHQITVDILESSQLVVKLLCYTGQTGTDTKFIQDLTSLGENVMMPFFSRHAHRAEIQDFRRRINPALHRRSSSFYNYQLRELSRRFHEDYLHSPREIMKHPIFWTREKCSGFICLVDELIDAVYTKVGISNLKTGINNFITSVKLLNVAGWHSKLYTKMKTNGCKFNKWAHWSDGNTVVGLLKCMRNVITHWDEYIVFDRRAIAASCGCPVADIEDECYEFFRHHFSKLVVHLYGCVELHYNNLDAALPSIFRWDFEKYVSSRAR